MDFENITDIKIPQDPTILSESELHERYIELVSVYSQHKNLIDCYRQRIYKLEQEKTLKDNVLQDELQSMEDNHEREMDEVRGKLAAENKELLSRIAKMNLTIDLLEQEIENLKSKVKEIQKQPSIVQKKSNMNEVQVSRERIEYLNKIETEHINLVNEIDDLKTQKSQILSQLMQSQKNLEELQEYFECSQENLKTKTVELEDTRNIIDSMQEKIISIEHELALFKRGEIDHNEKGNSLFAEVDDQRQEMRDLLNRQNRQYQMMKQKYNESHSEIKRLKRENADIHNEIKECIDMFKNADKLHKSKLNEHIGFLKTENNRLNEKLKQTQSEMDSLAKTQGVNWLSSMLEYCENETKDLNQKLMSYGMKKSEAESLCVQAKEEAAKWRFEALKSRCMIMNFEIFLEKNNIKFAPKLDNIRQLVPKLFDPNEVPMINNSLNSSGDFNAINVDNSNTISQALDSKVDNQTSGSWAEVKEIFDSLSTLETVFPIEHTKKDLKYKRRNNVELKSKIKDKNKMIPESDERSESSRSFEDKENADILNRQAVGKGSSFETLQTSNNIDPLSSTFAASVSKIDDQSPCIQSTNDVSNRVRQLNVQVYTVCLRGEGSKNSKKMNEQQNTVV